MDKLWLVFEVAEDNVCEFGDLWRSKFKALAQAERLGQGFEVFVIDLADNGQYYLPVLRDGDNCELVAVVTNPQDLESALFADKFVAAFLILD